MPAPFYLFGSMTYLSNLSNHLRKLPNLRLQRREFGPISRNHPLKLGRRSNDSTGHEGNSACSKPFPTIADVDGIC